MTESFINSPIISVIIPAYNCETTIKATIDSVLTQSFTNFELIIINDGSQDNTLDVVSRIQDSRIKIFSFENAGGNISRNCGLKISQGKFISFLDADDIWMPDKLKLQLEALYKNPGFHVAYSWTDYIDEDGNFLTSGKRVTLNGDVYQKLLINNFLENGSNPLILRDALVDLEGFDQSLKAAQDWDMWLRLAEKYLFVSVPLVQILYRVSSNSLSANLARQEKYCLQVLEKAYQARPTIGKHILHLSIANIYKYLACKALQQPYSQNKGLTAIKFLWKYFLYDAARQKRISDTFKLFLKSVIIMMLPPGASTLLLTQAKKKSPKPELSIISSS
ncbi:glycosyltransferase [Nostoc parmelioides]|uniref:Glycosyltransferase n=1 Tax=Nostoc parmelioides FACHB-3921 TaxID=2692909 RepID=A0ABR8BMK3_9NOSO|nr:glycosyltransferase [Nostoc parmelioides]MBD2254125.1 glycosyltransferase [Nostoc parmelioides FACHB-3921]